MKLIDPSVEIIKQPNGYNGIIQHIERCGRVSYKSEDRITEDSAEKFYHMLKSKGHLSPLEHGTIYLKTRDFRTKLLFDNNPYSSTGYQNPEDPLTYYITTNARVIEENNWFRFMDALCDPTKYHDRRVTVKFTISRAIAQEFTRHRAFSMTMESQRYCVSGDTKLTYKNSHNNYTIADLYKNIQEKGNIYSSILIRVLDVDTGQFVYTKIKNIFFNGVKKVYKLTTKLGYSIKCTEDHKIYTPESWKECKNLNVGEYIYVNGKDIQGPLYRDRDWLENQYITLGKKVSEINKEFGYKQDVLRKWLGKFNLIKPKETYQLYKNKEWVYHESIILNKTFVEISKETGYNVSTLKKWAKKLEIPNKGTSYFNVGRKPWNRGLSEENDPRVKRQCEALRRYHHVTGGEKILKKDTSAYQKYIKDKCEICGTTSDLEVHHIDKDRLNNAPDNLMTVCSSCHQRIHNQSLLILHKDEIISKEYVGEEPVYDLEIENYHNYIANGIVVHNCNYSKNKFNNEITFIKPLWLDINSTHVNSLDPGIWFDEDELKEIKLKDNQRYFVHFCDIAESSYFSLLDSGLKPEEAREVLPNATKTELIMTGFNKAWEQFLKLRCAKDAHPEARRIANILSKELRK